MKKKIDKGTIFRTVILVLGLLNQVIAIIGSTSFAANPWYQVTSVIVTAAIAVVTYWYNNDWSSTALIARDIYDMIKDDKVTKEECNEFINKYKKDKEE